MKKYGIRIFGKTMGYIGLRLYVILWVIFAKTMILGKTFGIYYGIYWLKLLDIFSKLCDIVVHWIYKAKTKECIRQNYGI